MWQTVVQCTLLLIVLKPHRVRASGDDSDGTAELVATLVPAVITAIVFFALFFVLRAHFPNVYAPRAHWLKNAFESIELPAGLLSTFSLIRKVYEVPESELIDKCGADIAVYLRVYKLGLELFLVCSLVACVLLGVNSTGENDLSGLEALSMANIEDGSDRLWAHVVGMWVISAIIFYTLRTNYKDIVTITQDFKAKKMTNYAVMVSDLPDELCTDESLFRYFKDMYEDTYGAIIVRDIGSLTTKIDEYISTTLELEKVRTQYEIAQNTASEVPPSRPTMRRMSIALSKNMLDDVKNVGQKVDAIDYLSENQGRLRKEIEALRSDLDNLNPTSTGFVIFKSLATANAAARVLHAVQPGTVTVEMAPEPREVYWPGVVMSPLKREAGKHVVSALKIPLVWGYIIAILAIASIQNIDSLSKNKGLEWLSFINSLPVSIKGACQGLLPVILLAVLMGILPSILRFFAQRAGETSESSIQASVLGTHYAYQVVFVFFLTMFASAIFDSLQSVIDNPVRLFSLLGESVPAVGTFFMSYVLLQALAKFPSQLARLWPLIRQWLLFKRGINLDTEKMKAMEPGNIDFGKEVPRQLVIYLIVLAYANLAPIISFFGAIYFGIGYVTWKHNALMVYTPISESGGTIWHRVFKFIMVAVVISQATLIGVIAVKQGIQMGPFLLPLPVLSYLFFSHFDTKYAASVSTRVVAREVAAKIDRERGLPTDSELGDMLLAFKQPELVFDLDDILYHSSRRCVTSACLANPPPKDTWILSLHNPRRLSSQGRNPYVELTDNCESQLISDDRGGFDSGDVHHEKVSYGATRNGEFITSRV